MNETQERATTLPSYDVQMLLAVLAVVGVGIVMVYSASSALALKNYGSDFCFLKKQALYSLFGFLALVACAHIPYRIYRALIYPALFLALGLMLAVLFTEMGMTAGGSSRWLRIGPVTFQPAELARVVLVIYMAYSLSKKQDNVRMFTIGFVPHFLMLAVFSVLLLMQPDFGSMAIFAALTWLMMFVGGVPLRHLLSVFISLLPVGLGLMFIAKYRIDRLWGFLAPWKLSDNEGYQITHSLMAFGTGGFWGTGIGNGYQKLFLPARTPYRFYFRCNW